ncbi:glycosyltransferase [Flavobacterium yafengii]|uniref:Glycosyltransferase n=1 Tax=Flavobacterium yafengii TaxID=3041253 RepID=A0AAW6TMB1_9FLAO|nr:glycosyltransferase [Flavobacterium yafengii]MDI5950741.1 glycosyltransferase [Flavobacterium yafengii]
MKILHVINNLATGGAEKLILETIPLLKQREIEVDLLVLNGIDYPYMKQLKELNCCAIYSLGNGSLSNPLLIFKIIPYLKKYDLIHVHLFPTQYWVVFAKLLSFSKTKLVFTEHSTSNRRIQNKWFKYIDRFVYSFYSKIICITDEVEEVLKRHTSLDKYRFKVIENGVNLKAIEGAFALDKKNLQYSIQESDKLVIQVAGFRIEKDQKTVIRAMQYLDKNVKLLLVGDGALLSESEKLVNELGLQERIFFLGVRNDVPSLLKTADILVVSSHWEGFGLAAVEGMAVSKPIIATNVAGLSNVVKGAGILFERGNEKELANIVKELFSDVEYYSKVGNAGFERAKKYDINFMVEKLIYLYKEVLK